ncbi:MAG TPA: hypothetical protein VMT19_09415 [Thermoanaerobaculaceae bacterium]|nr:hypothetical protein [Thermoanaerobaculaceae bacterium]
MPLISAVVLVAAGAGAARAATPPGPLRLTHVTLAVRTRDVLGVTLHAPAPPAAPASGMTAQHLEFGGARIALTGAVDVTVGGGETRADFEIRLADVPDGVLAVDPNRAPVLWEGIGGDGAVVLAIAGTVDLGDPGDVDVPVKDLYRAYVSVSDFSAVPGLAAVSVHGLLGLYNPFPFEVAATRLQVKVTAGANTVLAMERGGFRLRPRQRSDVLLDQDVPLADAAGGVAAFLKGEPAVLEGAVILRTPRGDRPIPLRMSVAR